MILKGYRISQLTGFYEDNIMLEDYDPATSYMTNFNVYLSTTTSLEDIKTADHHYFTQI